MLIGVPSGGDSGCGASAVISVGSRTEGVRQDLLLVDVMCRVQARSAERAKVSCLNGFSTSLEP